MMSRVPNRNTLNILSLQQLIFPQLKHTVGRRFNLTDMGFAVRSFDFHFLPWYQLPQNSPITRLPERHRR